MQKRIRALALILVCCFLVCQAPLMIRPARSTADAPVLIQHFKCNVYGSSWVRYGGGPLPDTYFEEWGLMGFLHNAYDSAANRDFIYSQPSGQANVTPPTSGFAYTEFNFTSRINASAGSAGGVFTCHTNRSGQGSPKDNWVNFRLISSSYNSTHYRIDMDVDSEHTPGYAGTGSVYENYAYLDGYFAHQVFVKVNSSATLCRISMYWDNAAVITNALCYDPYAGPVQVEPWNQQATHFFGPITVWGDSDDDQGTIEPGYAFPGLTASVSNVEGCGDWVFVDERYYKFNITVEHTTNASIIDTVRFRFPVDTPDGVINSTFQWSDDNWTLTHQDPNGTYDGLMNPTRIREGNVSYAADWSAGYFIFEVWFTEYALDEYQDAIDIDVWANDTAGDTIGWATATADVFFIYNNGGFSQTLTTTGTASLIAGGPVFGFESPNASSIYRDLYFRNLAHIKFNPEIEFNIGTQVFTLSYGIDYCTQADDWVTGWHVELEIEAATYGAERHCNWTITWFNNVTPVHWHGLYMFHRGDKAAVGEVTYTRFWVDLWFDMENASGTGGGRVNAYEFPMKDNANSWLQWLSSNWGPMDNVSKESMCLVPLADSTGPITTADIKMVRVWSRIVTNNAGTVQDVHQTNFISFDLTFSRKPFEGIQTPHFDETITPVMPHGGLIGVLAATIAFWGQLLADNIVYGGLGIWPALVAFLDTVAATLGMPGGFSMFLDWLGNAWGWLSNSLSWLVSVVTPIFTFLGAGMTQLITIIANLLATWASMLGIIWDMLAGGVGTGVNAIESFGLVNWLIFAAIIYPLHLVILWDDEGFDAMESEIRLLWDILAALAGGFIKIVMLIQAVIGRIIESIPIAE